MGFGKKFIKSLGYSAFLGDERLLDELEGELALSKQAVEYHIRDWKEQEKEIPKLERKIVKVREKVRRDDD